jgi:DNA-binding transcriptional LysR family regulator
MDSVKMKEISWDDYKVAYQVALDGSLSKAGKSLRINHATVLRKINHLEEALEIKLFIRHQRGYKLTDAGHVLIDEMPELIANFARIENRLHNAEREISGELRLTTISSYTPVLTPLLHAFREQYPAIRIKLLSSDDIIALDSGVAHISLRVGPCPNGVDLIVKKISQIKTAYYAQQCYIEKFGLPKDINEFNNHYWALPTADKYRLPFINYVVDNIEKDRIVFQSNLFTDVHQAVVSGMGIGPIGEHQASLHPTLVKVDLDLPQAEEAMWFVYHKDLKHNSRISCFYDFLKNKFT